MVLDGTSLWDIDVKLRVFYHDSPSDNVNINKHKSLEFISEDDNVGGKKKETMYFTIHPMKNIQSLINRIGGIVRMNGFEIDYDRMNGKYLFVRTTAPKKSKQYHNIRRCT